MIQISDYVKYANFQDSIVWNTFSFIFPLVCSFIFQFFSDFLPFILQWKAYFSEILKTFAFFILIIIELVFGLLHKCIKISWICFVKPFSFCKWYPAFDAVKSIWSGPVKFDFSSPFGAFWTAMILQIRCWCSDILKAAYLRAQKFNKALNRGHYCNLFNNYWLSNSTKRINAYLCIWNGSNVLNSHFE